MNHEGWNRCNFCGKYIGIKDFLDKKASRIILDEIGFLTTIQTHKCYHIKCKEKNDRL